MISLELVLVGWVIVTCYTKRQFQIENLLKVNSKPICFLNKHFTSWNVSKCPYRSLDIERKTNLFFFQCLLESLCPFKKKLNFFLSKFIQM
jgi:hypothetical protein